VTVTCDGTSWTKPGPSGASTTNADAIVRIVNRPNDTTSLGGPNGSFGILSEGHQRAWARLTLNSIDHETRRNASRRG
jgi:hypothetical protein